jgi:hypothetical protein
LFGLVGIERDWGKGASPLGMGITKQAIIGILKLFFLEYTGELHIISLVIEENRTNTTHPHTSL